MLFALGLRFVLIFIELNKLYFVNKTASSLIKSVGLKVTSPREKVLEVFLENIDAHFSTEQVHQILINRQERIVLATVYRVLSQFEAAGILIKHQFGSLVSVYELSEERYHHHMVCLECRNIVEFSSDKIDQCVAEICQEKQLDKIEHRMTIYVKCKACQ